MSRFAPGSVFVAVLAAVAAGGAVSCSKSAGKDAPKVTNTAGPETVAVPGGPGAGGPDMGAGPGAPKGPDTAAAPEGAPPPVDNAFKLKPEEGELSIEVPPDAVAGKETTARVVVTPTAKYKINFEFSTKLTLKPPADVTVAKAELTAGGQGKVQGDAEKFEEKKLAFAVKLTPTKTGTHTVNGTFKFAVCDKDACLAKREVIAIQLAAK
jgi:hypothetical protein